MHQYKAMNSKQEQAGLSHKQPTYFLLIYFVFHFYMKTVERFICHKLKDSLTIAASLAVVAYINHQA